MRLLLFGCTGFVGRELLVVKGDYGQVRWNRPVPDVWLRMDHLEACC